MSAILPVRFPPMPLLLRLAWPLCLLLSGLAWATEDPGAQKSPASIDAEAGLKPKPFETKWEGAIGPVFSYSPEYAGSATRKLSVEGGFYLRYGRFTVSNSSGFATRRNKDDIFRGLGLDLVRDEKLRVGLSLRLDNGRRSSDAKNLSGIDDVRRTIRVRGSATRQLVGGFRLSAGWNTDLLGRGGGNLLDVGVRHDRRFSPRTTWSVGTGLAWADRRHLQSYFGVSPEESAASGYPVFRPGAGLRDVSVSTSFRAELHPRWVALGSVSASRLLGPAARSPLTVSSTQWGLSAGVASLF